MPLEQNIIMDIPFDQPHHSNATALCWLNTIAQNLGRKKRWNHENKHELFVDIRSEGSHLDVRAARDLDPISTVSNHIILNNLPVSTETDSMAAVFIDAVTTKLHPAVFLHSDTSSTIFKNAVCDQPGQLAALEHSDSSATVTVQQVGENIEGLTALHIEADCYRGRIEKALKTKWEPLCIWKYGYFFFFTSVVIYTVALH